jgi:SAM-dependent methyltransferase
MPATIRSLERIPIFGYVLQILIAFVRLPAMIRSQRQFQGYIVAQQLAIADHVKDTQRVVTNDLRTLEATVMARILAEQEKLQHAEAQLLLLTDRLSHVSQSLSQTRHEFAEQIQSITTDVKTLTTDVKTLGRNLATEEYRTIDELLEWDNFYAAFVDQFRGSAEEVEERLRFYLPFLNHLNAESNILDLGSGRAEWLELLTKQGLKPRGVEVNKALAERSGQQGFEVINTEMMIYLGQQPNDSLDLVTVFHLIEHFNIGKIIRLLDEIKRTLKPGGLLILETPNPENLVVGACNFYADPTHHKPIYPQTLIFLLRNKGFVDLRLEYLHPVDQSPFEGESNGMQQLSKWFYGSRDFSVIARKAQ